ncbi:MAG: DUF433 domain-containing protein [Candidatus Sumerlaeaceae bacterium]
MNARIIAHPDVCGGEPCIARTRVPVHIVLSHLAAGDNRETILQDFPRLENADIDACLEYAAYLCTEKSIPA